jgi:AhpD family alkylhydroperoxidase
MSGLSIKKVMRPLTFAQIRWVTPDRRGSSDPRIARIYGEMDRVFGVISPPIALHSPAPDTMAATWMIMYESLLAPGRISRPAKEAIATAISVANTCPYCVTIHGTMMEALDFKQAADAIAADSASEVADPEVRAISAWARASARADSAASHAPPFPASHAADAVAVVLQFQYFNRMVNVFLGEAPIPDGAPKAVLRVVRPMLGRFLHAGYRNSAPPGASLDLLPEAGLPSELWWAAGDARIAQAVARAYGAVEEAGLRSVPRAVRSLVLGRLVEWDGQPMGLSRAWVEEAVLELPASERAAGRLALLVALASYQVDETVIAAFRAGEPSDRALVELTSWASMAAAVRAAGWTWSSGSGPGRPVAVDGGSGYQGSE